MWLWAKRIGFFRHSGRNICPLYWKLKWRHWLSGIISAIRIFFMSISHMYIPIHLGNLPALDTSQVSAIRPPYLQDLHWCKTAVFGKNDYFMRTSHERVQSRDVWTCSITARTTIFVHLTFITYFKSKGSTYVPM